MREIKFRAVIDNKIYEVVEIGFNADGIVDVSIIDEFNGDWTDKVEKYPLSVVKLMQYTGLKDKNRKEIYEGDIVKRIYFMNRIHIFTVEFSDINAKFYLRQTEADKTKNGYMGGIDNQEIRNCEIIGNIYENPELIE